VEPKIRVYRKSDMDGLIALWRRCGLIYPWNDPATDIGLAVSSKQTAIYVAQKGERLIGTIMVGHDGHRGWLYYLGVDPKVRGRGVARKLVRQAERWLMRRKIPKVQLMMRETNLDAGNFYARAGYHPNPCRIMQRWLAKDRGAPQAPGSEDGKLSLIGGRQAQPDDHLSGDDRAAAPGPSADALRHAARPDARRQSDRSLLPLSL
jgi:GNAT superfamily N-acetyltransferase